MRGKCLPQADQKVIIFLMIFPYDSFKFRRALI